MDTNQLVIGIDTTRNALITQINNSGLPWTVVDMILKDLHAQVASMADDELIEAREAVRQAEPESEPEDEATDSVDLSEVEAE